MNRLHNALVYFSLLRAESVEKLKIVLVPNAALCDSVKCKHTYKYNIICIKLNMVYRYNALELTATGKCRFSSEPGIRRDEFVIYHPLLHFKYSRNNPFCIETTSLLCEKRDFAFQHCQGDRRLWKQNISADVTRNRTVIHNIVLFYSSMRMKHWFSFIFNKSINLWSANTFKKIRLNSKKSLFTFLKSESFI